MAIAKAAGLAGLAKIRERIESVKASMVPELAQRLGAAFVKQVADEFRNSQNPYGAPWARVERMRRKDIRARARRAKRGGKYYGDKPLVDTGRLRGSVTASPSGNLVRVSLPVQYASFHQDGTKHIARRQILPEASTGGLGPIWGKAANREANKLLKQHFGKR